MAGSAPRRALETERRGSTAQPEQQRDSLAEAGAVRAISPLPVTTLPGRITQADPIESQRLALQELSVTLRNEQQRRKRFWQLVCLAVTNILAMSALAWWLLARVAWPVFQWGFWQAWTFPTSASSWGVENVVVAGGKSLVAASALLLLAAALSFCATCGYHTLESLRRYQPVFWTHAFHQGLIGAGWVGIRATIGTIAVLNGLLAWKLTVLWVLPIGDWGFASAWSYQSSGFFAAIGNFIVALLKSLVGLAGLGVVMGAFGYVTFAAARLINWLRHRI